MARAEGDSVWSPLVPLLDEALLKLREPDRQAVILHFMEGQTFQEVGSALGVGEDAARKRVHRCLDQLTNFFHRRGFAVPALAAGAPLFTLSSHAAPAGLAASATTAGLAAAHSAASTLTLIKGALKIMAWTKMKTAVVAGVVVLLAAGTTTITVKEIQEHRTYPWQVRNANSDVLRKVPPQVGIASAKYPNTMGAGSVSVGDSGGMKFLGISLTFEGIISTAYGQSDERTIFLAKVPSGQFDYIANLPSGNEVALKKEIKRKFGLVGTRETRDTDVLLLKIRNSNATGLKSADPRRLEPHSGSSSRSGAGYITFRSQLLSSLAWSLEYRFKTPVIDQTGLTNLYDIDLNWDETDYRHPNLNNLKQALLDQLGLELVPSREPIEMLVVEKAKKMEL
jgi:uncharacterized protein (TIGR03435 family)